MKLPFAGLLGGVIQIDGLEYASLLGRCKSAFLCWRGELSRHTTEAGVF
jgi:hypothetical protein